MMPLFDLRRCSRCLNRLRVGNFVLGTACWAVFFYLFICKICSIFAVAFGLRETGESPVQTRCRKIAITFQFYWSLLGYIVGRPDSLSDKPEDLTECAGSLC